jgi:hypothetical protein
VDTSVLEGTLNLPAPFCGELRRVFLDDQFFGELAPIEGPIMVIRNFVCDRSKMTIAPAPWADVPKRHHFDAIARITSTNLVIIVDRRDRGKKLGPSLGKTPFDYEIFALNEASSSPTCRARPSGSSPFTTNAAHASIPRVWLAGRSSKRAYSRQFGIHLGKSRLSMKLAAGGARIADKGPLINRRGTSHAYALHMPYRAESRLGAPCER